MTTSELKRLGKELGDLGVILDNPAPVKLLQKVTKEEQQTGKIIFQQLGGAAFVVMTGCKNRYYIKNGVCIPIHYKGAGANWVKITLNGADLYDVTFYKVRKEVAKIVADYTDLWCDQLQEIFTAVTGLDTRMPCVIFG